MLFLFFTSFSSSFIKVLIYNISVHVWDKCMRKWLWKCIMFVQHMHSNIKPVDLLVITWFYTLGYITRNQKVWNLLMDITDRQTDRQTDKQTDRHSLLYCTMDTFSVSTHNVLFMVTQWINDASFNLEFKHIVIVFNNLVWERWDMNLID